MQVLQYFKDSPVDPRYQKCIDQVRSNLPIGVNYRFVKEHPYVFNSWNADYRYESDLVRLMYAVQKADLVYLDCDITINKFYYPEEQNIAYFFNNNEKADIAAFMVNGDVELFRELHDYYKLYSKYLAVGWMQNYINNNIGRDRYRLIPQGYFIHHSYHKFNKI